MRKQFILDLHAELIIDNFAGGGGWSTGVELALGRHVDHAANHAWDALGMHRINHPQTVHHCEDIFDIDPETICEGRPVGLCHNSPDCKHFSKAKGGKPLNKRIRGLVFVILKWAKYGARVITMENVEEIVTHGPLLHHARHRKDCACGKPCGRPDKKHTGRTWMAFLSILSTGIEPNHPDLPEILEVLGGYVTKEECVRGFGYAYQARTIRACDLGSPTIRKRLYLIARRDGRPIVWPEATHAPAEKARELGLKPYRTIAECIDWSLPCPSLFLNKRQAKQWRCKRPLAKSTLRRIAKGVDRYVLKAKRPFIVSLTHQGGDRVEGVDEPGRTVTGAHRGEKALVAPTIVNTANGKTTGRGPNAWTPEEPGRTVTASPGFAVAEASLVGFVTEHANATHQRNFPADEPSRTLCAEVKGGHFAMVAGTLVQTGYGEREGQEPRTIDPNGPGMTAVAGGCKQAVISGTLVGAGGRAAQSRPRGLDEEMHTITAKGDTCLAAASLVKLRGENVGHHPEEPGHTISAGGTHHGVVAASIVRHFGESVGQEADGPAPTVMADGGGKTGLIAAHLTKFCTGAVGQDLREPGPTVTAGSHHEGTHGGAATPQGIIAAYLAQHNGGEVGHQTVGHDARGPMSTISSKGSQQQVVAASMAAYYGSEADGQAVDEAARTVTAKARLGLVESTAVSPMTPAQIIGARRVAKFLRAYGVEFDGEFATIEGYVIVDLGMRMLTPRELFLAQGFPADYVIDRAWVVDPQTGEIAEIRLTKEQQIRMCGNSVCPDVAEAIVRCNVPELAVRPRRSVKRRRVLV